MKYGLNLLLWTDHVTDAHSGVLENIKKWGYDGVELPLFVTEPDHYTALGKRLDGLGLGRTAVTVSTPDANPIAPSATVRQAAIDRLKLVLDCCHNVGATHLCGPFHSALGQFSGSGPTADEWKRCLDTLRPVADHAQQAY